jgi:hypothetical protein
VKILLHMGQGKTGTTALQHALHGARARLARAGVLYPDFGGTEVAHHLLLPLVEDPQRLPLSYLLARGGVDATVEQAWQAWNRTCAALADDPPAVLVLSSEFLGQHTDGRAKARLAALLSELSGDVVPILYVRDPVAHFRSRLQEWLKVENRPLRPLQTPLRQAITDTEAAFGRPVMLCAFDPATLAQGDITADFASRFLAGSVPPGFLPGQVANPGLSAEALVLMCRQRDAAGGSFEASRRVARLIRPLAALDRADPPDRPVTLLPDVAAAVLAAATCHRWLAETGRLTLPGLDPARIDGTPLPDWLLSAAPDTLFPHDPARLARLAASLRQTHPDLLPV